MKQPEFSDFPLKEYLDRSRRLRAVLERAGIDALLVSSKENVTYFAGLLHGYYWVTSWDEESQFALLPASEDREPSLMIAEGLEETTRTSWIEDVRLWAQYRPGSDRTPLSVLAATIKDSGLDRARIAAEIGPNDRMAASAGLYEGLKEQLPEVEFVSCYEVVSEVRAVKSDLEVDCIRRACEITCKGFEAGLGELRAGMSEKELAHIICSTMLEHNPEGVAAHPWSIFLTTSGRSPVLFDALPSDYRFKKGDTVWIDGGAIYKGYWCDMLRCASIGAPSEDVERFYEVSRRGNEACMEMIRPGVRYAELWDRFVQVSREMGFSSEIDRSRDFGYSFLGHSIGLSPHEQPFITAQAQGCIAENMTLSIEGCVPDVLPWSKTRTAMKSEDNLVVTADGHELLTPMSRDLWVTPD